MARPRPRRGWPPPPAPLPAPVVDNHTHLDTVVGFVPDDGAPRGAGAGHLGEDGAGAGRPGEGGPGRPHPPRDVADHLTLAAAVGVPRVVQIGCDVDSARWTDAIVREHRQVLGGVGIHPNEAVLHAGVREIAPDGLTPAALARHDMPLDEAIATTAVLAERNSRLRVIGETGLDYFRAGQRGREVQRRAFREHLALAKELDLVLQIHDRDAHDDVIDVLERDGAPERTVFHCFSGDAAMAERCIAHGWYLSFAGPVTFAANGSLREALAVTPLERLLVETDAPYLTPHPLRGQPNAPYLLPHTVRAIAQERNVPLHELCEALERTARDLYGT